MSSYKAKLREAHAQQLKLIQGHFPDDRIQNQNQQVQSSQAYNEFKPMKSARYDNN